jgi:phage N-6-adenine-methyltransferase
MALIKSMVSSKSNEWVTPQSLFDDLNYEFRFTLDPCSTDENAKCKKHFTIKDDGLSKSWQNKVVFMNPPYGGHTGDWIQKAYWESEHAIVVCLIVSSTDRSYWHDWIFPYAKEIRFLRGRLHFNESKSSASFASAIVIFDGKRSGNGKPKITFYRKNE